MQGIPTIILAEDDEGHALLIRRGLEKVGFFNPVRHFPTGDEALEFLRSAEGSEIHSKVLLLDIRMPGTDGVEVLRQLRSEPPFDAMPIVIITTTDDPAEAARCHALGCSHYIVKTVNRELFNTMLRPLELFLRPSPSS